ncbi:hypothetical protein DDE82_001795 [Stemphylium lycopersici]|nr:hypothetical protein TW65_08019 [Stemphylium lycopersici]RAR09285.1 hypothetical protein DDE82_001795 [Stemphylium lycopersici]
MSSTPSPPNLPPVVHRNLHQRFLKTHLTSHELTLVTAVVTLMLLVAHTAATHGMQPSGLPQKWLHDFVHQLYEGTKTFTWIIMYIMLYPNVRYKDEERRQKRRVWLKNFFGKIASCVPKPFRRNQNDRQASATETKRSPNDTARQIAAEGEVSKRTSKTNSQPAPYHPLACHPLLHLDFSTLQRLVLLTLWDVIMILTLSSHIYIFLRNIEPSLKMCHNPISAHTSSPRSISLLLNSKAKCHRLNWRIHSAGGYSAGGAAILGTLHLFASTLRLYEYVRAKRPLKPRKTVSDGLKRSRKRKQHGSSDEQHWRNPPRDIVVRPQSSPPQTGFSSSLSPGIHVYSLPSTVGTPATRHQATISQEEQNAGVLQRGGVRTTRSQQQESENVDHQSERSRWEALLDTLIP